MSACGHVYNRGCRPYIPPVYTNINKENSGRETCRCFLVFQYTIMPLYNLFALELFEERAFGDAQIAGAAEGGKWTVLF